MSDRDQLADDLEDIIGAWMEEQGIATDAPLCDLVDELLDAVDDAAPEAQP